MKDLAPDLTQLDGPAEERVHGRDAPVLHAPDALPSAAYVGGAFKVTLTRTFVLLMFMTNKLSYLEGFSVERFLRGK